MRIEEFNKVIDEFITASKNPDRLVQNPTDILELLRDEINERFVMMEEE